MEKILSQNKVDVDYEIDTEKQVVKTTIRTGTWDVKVLETPFSVVRWLFQQIGIQND